MSHTKLKAFITPPQPGLYSFLSMSRGSAPLLLCNPEHTASRSGGKQTCRSSNSRQLFLFLRKSRQLVPSPSTGDKTLTPEVGKGELCGLKGKAAGAEPGGDRARTLTACEQQELHRLCETTHQASVRGQPLLQELPSSPSSRKEGHPAAAPAANQPRAPRAPGCCRH